MYAGSQMNPSAQVKQYGKMLPGQGYYTPLGVVTHKYGAK